MDGSRLIPNDYESSLFVDRVEDIQRVVDLVHRLAVGESVSRRTVIFRGERGCGKTWLLRHLAEDIYTPADMTPGMTGKLLRNQVAGVKSWYLSLAAFSGASADDSVKRMIKALREQMGQWRGETPVFSSVENLSFHELSNLVMRELNDLLQNHVVVLILDHVYETPKLLEVLEDRLLAPLAGRTQMVIVMAGRGPGYAWKAPELRLRVDEYWLQGLGVAATMQPSPPSLIGEIGFEPKQIEATEEQLCKQLAGVSGQPPIEAILSATHGHPLSNLLVAAGKSHGEIVDELLRDKSQSERQMLRLGCVLRFFDEAQISGLRAACMDDVELGTIAVMQPRDIVGVLLRTNLVRYDTDLSAYVMDEVIRGPLEGDLEEQRRDLWQRLHQTAQDMYCRWMKEFPQAEARLRSEAEYHAKRLGKFDEAVGACPESQAHEES